MKPEAFPRYFRHTECFLSDAVYVRHDTADDAVVVTTKGERPSLHGKWPLADTLLMVSAGKAEEITAAEAARMMQ